MNRLPALVVPAKTRRTSALIFLHGLGDTGHGWSAISENFRLRRKFDECTFIFPHAPTIPITLNFGMLMPGWFDTTDISNIPNAEDEAGILRSVEAAHNFIEHEIEQGVPSERIVLGGFSQGGAIALLAGLTCKHKLGGIVALSTWMPLHRQCASMCTDANKNTPVFQAHGELDKVVKYEWGVETTRQIKDVLGHPIEWHSYPHLEHSADSQELGHLEKWMEERIPPLD